MAFRVGRRTCALVVGILLFEAAYAQPIAASTTPKAPAPSAAQAAKSRVWEPASTPERAAQVEQALAVDAKPGEVVARRTPSSDVVVAPDGTETTTLYGEQVYWKPDGATQYQPVKVGFAPLAAGDPAEVSADAPVAVQVAPANDQRGFLAVTIGGHTISYRPADGAKLGPSAAAAPNAKGALADVSEVSPGLSARVLARADGAHVFYVLNSAADGASVSYAVDAPGLSLAPDGSGGYAFQDPKGATVALLPNPYAVDSAPDTVGLGSGHTTSKVSYSVSGTASHWTVTVTVDPDWLKGATYPVYVDPTLVANRTNPYGDTFVNKGNATYNYFGYCRPDSPYYCELWLGQSPSPTTDVATDYVKFDLSPVAGTTIDTAYLEVYPYHQYMGTTAMNTYIRQLTSAFGSSTTYNSRPSASGTGVVQGTSKQGTWTAFDVAGIVRNWVHSGQANYGFQIDEGTYGYTYWKRLISAKETGYSHPEQLVITNHVPTAAIVAPTGWTAVQQTSWTYADSKGAAQAKYHVDIASDAGFSSIVASSGDVASAATSWNYTASLNPGSTYYWRVRVFNGSSWSAWASHSFGWDPSTPAFGDFTQPASEPTIVGASNAWTVAWPQVTSASGISSLNLHQAWGHVVTPGTCDGVTQEGTSSWGVLPTTATSYPVSNGTSGYCYWYWLDATNGVGSQGTGPNSKNILVDTTAPTAAFTWPPSGTTTTAVAPVVEWTETETGTGVTARSLVQQWASVTAPGTCGTTWTTESTATGSSPVTETTQVGRCYQWVLTLTDGAGNQSVQTSGTLIRDGTAALGRLPYQASESWSLGGGDALSVNVASGNAVLTHPVATLPIRGGSLALSLVYNSQDATTLDLGRGARLNVERRLTLNTDGTVTFIDADGSRETFTNPVTNGTVTTYTRPATFYATLVKDTSLSANEFVLTYRDQSADKFDIAGSEGILVRAEDRFGNGVALAYVAGTNRISTITDTAGSRTVSFAYDASNRVSSITDWAWIDASGVVQTTGTGSHRVYRFFYDGSGNLAGWADPLNTAGSCPTGGSHLTCLAYPANELDVAKTQTVTTAGASALSTTSRVITSKVLFAGSSVSAVKDAQQTADAGTGTTLTGETSTRILVNRPTMTTLYGLVSAADPFVRTQSIWRRDAEDGVDIEQRTSWDAANPAEPAWVAQNYGGLLNTPEVRTSYTYVSGSMGLVSRLVEPLTATSNRRTDSTYNANNDVLTTTVSLDGASPVTTQDCYTGLALTRVIQNAVSAACTGTGFTMTADTNVTTDYAYDAYGQKTRETRHNRNTAGAVLDDRATGYTYDLYGNQTSQIANYADGVVTNGGTDTNPDATGARTDLTTVSTYDTAGNRVSSADPRRAIDLTIPNTQTIAFAPTDDAYVRDAAPTINYGSDTFLEARATGGSQGLYESYLKFTVTGIIGQVTGVTLRLTNLAASNKSTRHVCLYRVADTTWAQGAITNATKPAADAASLVCITGNQAAGAIDYVLPASAVPGPGIYAFKLTNDTTFDVEYASQENGTSAGPSLLVSVSYGPLAADDYVSRWTFDALNEQLTNQTAKTFGLTDQKTSTQTFDELGAVRQAVDTGGVVTGTGYDRDGRSLAGYEDTDGAGAGAPATTSASSYDADGHVLTEKNRSQVGSAALGYMRHVYDSLGRETTATDAYGSTPDASSDSSTSYDALDRKFQTSDAGQDTSDTFDLAGRTLTTDDGFACTATTYDVRDHVVTTTTGLNSGGCSSSGATWSTTTNTYDGLGRQLTAAVTSSFDGSGVGDRTSDITLDAAGNTIVSKAYKAATAETTQTQFTLNILDEAVVQTASSVVGGASTDKGTTKFAYDPAGNATDRCFWSQLATPQSSGVCLVVGSVVWPAPLPTQNTSTAYDARNQRLQLVDGLTNAVTVYDPLNNYQPAAVYTPTGSGHELQALYAYDARHRLATITDQLCTLSGSGHACSSTVAAGSDAYTYDGNDNRTRVIESNGAASLDRYYCYDARDQLITRGTGAGCAGADEGYTYDPAGNRLTAPGHTYTYSPDGQLCQVDLTGVCPTDPATWQVRYDDAGRTASLSGWSFRYDSEGRLTSACQAASCTGSGFNRVDSTYDGDGHRTRIVETTTAGAVTTTDFRYQGDAVASEQVTLPASATIGRTFVSDEAGRITKVTIADSATPANNGTYLVTYNGHGDALGLWRQNADGTLTLANSYAYTTWGAPTTTLASGFNDLGFRYLYVGASGVAWDNGFGLGLLYMHARHYSPTTARFLQTDPARADGNLYRYAENSPVTKSDPSGEFCIVPIVGWVICGAAAWTVVTAAVAGAAWAAGNVGHYAGRMISRALAKSGQVQANQAQGRSYEDLQKDRLRQQWPFIAGPIYFWTPWGGRFLDACAYSSFNHFVYNMQHPLHCWEFKSSPGAAHRYWVGSSWQYDKDVYIMDTYHFPISVIWLGH